MNQATQSMDTFLQWVTSDPTNHGKFLNTLSLMENTGAHKIAKYQNSMDVTLTLLKHGAEEFRHAYIFKKSIAHVTRTPMPHYTEESIFNFFASKNYISRLEFFICRRLKKEFPWDGVKFKTAVYLLVTLAIEIRAQGLYGLYAQYVEKLNLKVPIKSILLEEKGHLEEIIQSLQQGYGRAVFMLADDIQKFEGKLFKKWMEGCGEYTNRPELMVG